MDTSEKDTSTRLPVLRLRGQRLAALVATGGILGMATTVLVAWMLAVFPHKQQFEPTICLPFVPPNNQNTYQPPYLDRSTSVGRAIVIASSYHAIFTQHGEFLPDLPQSLLSKSTDKPLEELIPSWAVVDARRAIEMNVDASPGVRRFVNATGWPLLAMVYVMDNANPTRVFRVTSGGVVTSEWLSRLTGSPGTVFNLPFRVLWKGAAVDTATFGAIWSIVLFASGRLRRRLRVHRGLCPRCAYDLKDQRNSGCPECGWMRSAPLRAGER